MSIGILLYFMIPRSPKLAYFLDDTQRELAAARVEEELRHRKDESIEKGQIKRALMAPITWMCGLGFFLTNITVQSFSLFLVPLLLSPSLLFITRLLTDSPRFSLEWDTQQFEHNYFLFLLTPAPSSSQSSSLICPTT